MLCASDTELVCVRYGTDVRPIRNWCASDTELRASDTELNSPESQ